MPVTHTMPTLGHRPSVDGSAGSPPKTSCHSSSKRRPASSFHLSTPKQHPSHQLTHTPTTSPSTPSSQPSTANSSAPPAPPHKHLRGNSQQSRTAVGDHWTLLGPRSFDADPDPVPLRNSTGEHQAFESTDVWFRVDAATSGLIRKAGGSVQLAFVQQWPRVRDSKVSNKWRWDVVSALVLLPVGGSGTVADSAAGAAGAEGGDGSLHEDGDGGHSITAIRLAAVLLEKDDWLASAPRMGRVTVV